MTDLISGCYYCGTKALVRISGINKKGKRKKDYPVYLSIFDAELGEWGMEEVSYGDVEQILGSNIKKISLNEAVNIARMMKGKHV